MNALGSVPTPAAGEHILVSSDNSMNAAGQGNFDCYIVGDGTKAASALTLQYINAIDRKPTSGSDNAVSSGGVFNDLLFEGGKLDLSRYVEVQAYPNTNGTWLVNSSNYQYYGVFIPIHKGSKIKIKARTAGPCYVALVKNPKYYNGLTIEYATGEARRKIESEDVSEFTAPTDALYLYVSTKIPTDTKPEYVIISEPSLSIKEKTSEISEKVEELRGILYEKVYQRYISGSNVWVGSSNYYGTLLPVSYSDRYIIEAGNYACGVAVLKTDSFTAGNTPDFSDEFGELILISANGSLDLTIPSDGHYLYLSLFATPNNNAPKALFKVSSNFIVENNYESNSTTKAISVSRAKKLNDFVKGATIENVSISWLGGTSSSKYKYNESGELVKVPSRGSCIGCAKLDISEFRDEKIQVSTWCGTNNYNSFEDENENIIESWAQNSTAGVYVEKIVPNNAKFLLLNNSFAWNPDGTTTGSENTSPYLKAPILNDDSLAAKVYNMETAFPSLFKVGNLTDVIYTIDEFILGVEGGTENSLPTTLKFSTDLGKTWKYVTNTFGEIINAHVFSDGTLLFFAKNNGEGCKGYYTKDFETFSESTIYDVDGSVFSPASSDIRFFMLSHPYKHTYVNGTEFFLFGDYVITTKNPRLWYSNDFGRTIHSSFAFGVSQISGQVISARHIHAFVYNEYNQHFYAFTGDSISECHIMRGTFINNMWEWEILATGGEYKLTSPVFDSGNVYAVTDFTESSLSEKKGVLSCPINDIDSDNYRYLFHATSAFMASVSYSSNPAALSGYLCDRNGWRFATTDYLGNTKHLLAKNNHDFVAIDNNKDLKFNKPFGPNYNGDCYAEGIHPPQSVSGESWLHLSRVGTYNITEMLRNSGAKDFFNYNINEDGY